MTVRHCSLPREPAPAFAPGLATERLGAPGAGRRWWDRAPVSRRTSSSIRPRRAPARWAPSATPTGSWCCSRNGTGSRRFLAGHDGGTAPNARIAARLVKGRRYPVRIRLYSTWGPGETAVMCW